MLRVAVGVGIGQSTVVEYETLFEHRCGACSRILAFDTSVEAAIPPLLRPEGASSRLHQGCLDINR